MGQIEKKDIDLIFETINRVSVEDRQGQYLFSDIILTLYDFVGYSLSFQRGVYNCKDKKNFNILTGKDFKKQLKETEKDKWYEKISDRELFVTLNVKIANSLRKDFENAVFRLASYRDKVVGAINKLAHFGLKVGSEESTKIDLFLNSSRINYFPSLKFALRELKKLENIISYKNKYLHSCNFKMKFEANDSESGLKFNNVIYHDYTELLLSKLGHKSLEHLEDLLNKLKNSFSNIGTINTKLINYYLNFYDPKTEKKENPSGIDISDIIDKNRK